MKNVKTYMLTRVALVRLEKQLAAEAKLDPRFKRGHNRTKNMLRLLDGALEKYEIVHGRKVPAKVQAKSGGKKAAAKKRAPKKVVKSNVVQLKTKAAAARAKGNVRRSR